jgi:hypothetical protein
MRNNRNDRSISPRSNEFIPVGIFFSRSEPHIKVTLAKPCIGILCQVATLPITREIDGEIELYL